MAADDIAAQVAAIRSTAALAVEMRRVMRSRGHVFEESETAITPEKILALCDALPAVWQAAREGAALVFKFRNVLGEDRCDACCALWEGPHAAHCEVLTIRALPSPFAAPAPPQPSVKRMFRAMAERVEAGEPEAAVLHDYGLMRAPAP